MRFSAILIPATLLVAVSLAELPALATPIKVSPKELLRERRVQTVPLMPARVGWREDAAAQPPRNLTYDRIMYPETPQGIREQLRQLARPNWAALLGALGLILCLRMLRARDSRRRLPEIATMPTPEHGLRAA